jgi:hypothetical protein
MRTTRKGWTTAFVGMVVFLLAVPVAWAHAFAARELFRLEQDPDYDG